MGEKNLKIEGTIGLSIVAQHVYEQYPILWNIIVEDQRGPGLSAWGSYSMLKYYDAKLFTYDYYARGWYDEKNWNILLDTYQHTIYTNQSGDGVRIVVKCSGKVNKDPYSANRDTCNKKQFDI